MTTFSLSAVPGFFVAPLPAESPWGFGVRESKPPWNDAFGLSGTIRFDQGSTDSRPTRWRTKPITCVVSDTDPFAARTNDPNPGSG